MPLFRDGECEPLRRWPEFAQILSFSAIALFLNYALGFLIMPLGFTDAQEFLIQITDKGMLLGFLSAALVAPFYETFIGQWFPLFAAKIFRRKPFEQLIWATVWFSILHLSNGPAHVIQNLGVGWVLASCFLFCWKETLFKAIRVTFAVHAIHNTFVFTIFLLSQQS